MKVVVLYENTSQDLTLKHGHGLSLYIETGVTKILFDVGADASLIHNARRMKIDLSTVDTILLSHGHRDHTGGILDVLQMNDQARIYMHPEAGQVLASGWRDISMPSLKGYENRMTYVDGEVVLDQITLFQNQVKSGFIPEANGQLFKNGIQDDFNHEIHMLIEEDGSTVFTGCAHSGMGNILHTASTLTSKKIKAVIGGMHLNVRREGRYDRNIMTLIEELKPYKEATFYTGHCTGDKAFEVLREHLASMKALTTGMVIDL